MSTSTARIAAALVGGGVLALSVPALAAVNVSSPPAGVALQIVGTGTVVARGAAARVTVRVTCPASSSTSISAQTTERVGRGIAAGSDARMIICTNVPKQVTLTFAAQAGGRAFAPGTAVTSASLQSYLPASSDNVELHAQRVVTLKAEG